MDTKEEKVKVIIRENMNWLEEMLNDRITDLLFMEHKIQYKDKVEKVELLAHARQVFFAG